MKIHAEFKEIIEERFAKKWRLTTAWFTTFTLSPEFFETFILPALLGKPDLTPKSFTQFEEIASELREQEKSTSIQVFYDASIKVDGLKRTPVHFNGVFIEKGFFHPKVSLLIFEKEGVYKSWVCVGSANIGLDGWARNKEGVVWKLVETSKQLKDIQKFFSSFAQKAPRDLVKTKVREHGEGDWDFVFTSPRIKKDFFSHLSQEQSKWVIWSPYFSKKAYLKEFQERVKAQEVFVVPDQVGEEGGQKVRMTDCEGIDLFEDERLQAIEEKMVHAKIWLSDRELIVGSHNFTKNALERVNVEASLKIPLGTAEAEGIWKSVNLKKVVSPQPMTEKELKDNDMPEKEIDFCITAIADHKNKSISIEVDGEKEIKQVEFHLPGGISKTVTFTANREVNQIVLEPKDARKFWEKLVTEKQITGKSKINGKDVFGSGFFCEIGLEQRNAFKYSSLENMILDELNSQSKRSSESNKRMVHVSEASEEEEAVEQASKNAFDYLQMFEFFNRLRKNASLLNKAADFKEALWFSPSSVSAIKELADDLSSEHKSKVFSALIKIEVNTLIDAIQSNQNFPKEFSKEAALLKYKNTQIGLSRAQMSFVSESIRMEVKHA